MPSPALYKYGEEGLLGAINLTSDAVKARLVTTYSYASGHTTMTAVTTASGTTDPILTGKTVTSGVFNANNPSWTTVQTGTLTATVLYKFVTNDDDSIPIAYLPLSANLVANGGNVTVNWDTGANKIFALG